MFKEYNPNPVGNNVGDCVIRAITKAMDKSWEDTYIDIVVQGFLHSDMPSSNHVWDAYLRDGYAREGSYEGNSYRKRNRMGQFSRYSREGEKDQLVEKLETLMEDTTNGGDRQELRQKVMDIMNKYK